MRFLNPFCSFLQIRCLTLIGMLLSSALALADTNQNLVYQGRILRPDGTALNSGSITFSLSVYSPGPKKCLLYSETQTLNMAGSSGMFSLALGAGSRSDAGSHSFEKIFVNGGSLTGLTCADGTTVYIPASTDDRNLIASFNDAGTVVQLSAMSIKSVPFALQAHQVGGYGINDLVKVHPTTGSATTFTTAELGKVRAIGAAACATNEILKWNGTAWTCSADATGGSPMDAAYTAVNKGVVAFDTDAATSGITITSGVAKLSDVNSNVGTFGSATKTVTFTVNAQGRITAASHQDIAIPASQITQSSANTGEVLKWNGSAWAPAADAGTTTDASYAAKGIVQFDTNAATSGVSVTSGLAKVNFGTGANQIVKLDGSGRLPAVDGSQLTNLPTSSFTGTLPPGSGGTGQSSYTAGDMLYATGATATSKLGIGASGTILTSSGTAPQWSSISSLGFFVDGGNTVTGTATLGTNSNHNLEIETNGSTKMTVEAGGDVGIGITNPVYRLDVNRSGLVANDSYIVSRFSESNSGSGISLGYIVNSGGTAPKAGFVSTSSAGVDLNLGPSSNNTAVTILDSNGNVGVAAAAPSEKFEVGGIAKFGTLRVGSNVTEKSFQIDFPNGVANQKVDLLLGNAATTASFVVTLSSSYFGELAVGVLEKTFVLSASAGGTINHQEAYYSKAVGPVADRFAISDVSWDAVNSVYRVQIVHRTSVNNPVYVSLRALHSETNAVFKNASLGSIYTTDTTVFAKPQMHFLGNIGFGVTDPSSAIDLTGSLTARGITAPSTSPAGQGRIYYDSGTNKFRVSQNGAAYVDLVQSGTSDASYASKGVVQGLTDAATSGLNIASGVISVNAGTGANQVVKLNGSSQLPALDGSLLTNLSAANITAGTLPVGRGGTGATTLTSNGVLLGNGTSAVSATAAGAAYSVLRVPSGGGAPAFGAIDLSQSAAVTGTLPIGRGGTGMTSFAVDRLIGTTGAGALQAVTCGQYKVLSFSATGVYGCYDVGDVYPGFTNGGNTATATMVLGTNSNQDLEIESNGTSRLYIMKDGRVGVGAAPTNFFDVGESSDHTANQTFYTSVVSNSFAPATPSDSVVYALDGIMRYDTAVNSPNANLTGISGDVGNWSTGLLGNARGTTGNVNNWDAGSIGNATGVEGRIENVAGGTIDVATALYGQVIQHSTGPINTGYGLYIDAINATNKFSIYSSDATARSYIAGKVGIGATDPYHKFEVRGFDEDVGGRVMNSSSSTSRYPSFTVENFNGGNSGYPNLILLNSNGSSSSPSHIEDGDMLGGLVFAGGSDTNWNYRHGALISASAAEDFDNSGSGTHMRFWTTPINTTGELERMRIEENGNVGIGTTDPTHKLHVAGSVKIVDGTQGNGKVLTSDANGVASWQNAGGGSGAMTLISTQTASNSAELVWTGISGTYKSLSLECAGIRPDTNNVQLRMQYGEGATPTWLAASYSWHANMVGPSGSGSVGASSVGTYIGLTRDTTAGLGNGNAARALSGKMMFSNFGSSDVYKYLTGTVSYHSPAGAFNTGTVGGVYEGSTNPITAIRIFFASGNIAGGSCSLYGLAN